MGRIGLGTLKYGIVNASGTGYDQGDFTQMNTTDNQEEILIHVDEDNKIIGYLPRGICHQQNLLHRTISVMVYNDKNEILLQKRSATKDNYPGMYALSVGGHVLKDQNYEEAATREAVEELGVEITPELIKTVHLKDPKHNTFTSIYKAKHNGPFKMNFEEIDELKFLSEDAIKSIQNQITPPGILILKTVGILQEN